ncbi:predicted protein [Verticillium alfalfae VaMs.102]|uniref:Predicted protein n=1 Tax=Verticillium alfalfae (strain VaMs.102 / ATCC MYA-4576 / FGSC 10136) TaxID=526221 RepID=C9SPJ4_VERA1|nr:predicted protein [Verticillium alfalfae VaMs.102]EEY20709.1 predicted protein [Verticillium alfalfae VaMs.102]
MQGAGVSSSEDELVLLLALLDESERGFQENVLARRWKDVVDELEWWPEAAEAVSDASDLRTLRRKWSRIAIVVGDDRQMIATRGRAGWFNNNTRLRRNGQAGGDGRLKTAIPQWTLMGVSVGVARLKPAQPFALAGSRVPTRLGSVESSNRIGGTVGKRLNRPPRSSPSIRFLLASLFSPVPTSAGSQRDASASSRTPDEPADGSRWGLGRMSTMDAEGRLSGCVTVRACLRDSAFLRRRIIMLVCICCSELAGWFLQSVRCAGETPRLPAAARMKPAGREWTPARGHPRHSACEQPLQTGQGSIERRGTPSATRRYVMLARAPLRQDPAKSRPRSPERAAQRSFGHWRDLESLKEVTPGGLGPFAGAGCGF